MSLASFKCPSWLPKYGEHYYNVEMFGGYEVQVVHRTWTESADDILRFKVGNVLEKRKYANKIANKVREIFGLNS